ncbi:hypothetical protein COCMIDRAFT_88222 [Bipolaris oryzae ATCC 44560]|uniref:Uncharacterized protein n=1 Tax=Bipolaris oryzae ATCC 44560 TaxID=930090 RepID=W6ZDZ1_COCMI|nr:uncharacterized protein COCMIDRAFT_88222 [Bipolaris oryzae ATCC 44560]EUC48143.1 hypothetical protein COCMIDRAFT_88222 [Bipolaris oryzae ATCC 44560]
MSHSHSPSSSSHPTPSSTPPPQPRCPSCTSLLTSPSPSSTYELRTCDTCFVRLRCTESLWGSTRSGEITFFPRVLDDEDFCTEERESEEEGDGGVKEVEEEKKRGLFAWVVGRR